jgi:ABC-2 type transport system permease protein
VLKTVLLLKWKSLAAQFQYSESFAIEILTVSLIGLLRIPGLLILTGAFGSIGGWDFHELVFLVALVQMAHGLHHALFFRFFLHRQLLREGEFDRMLVRPLHPIWQMLGGRLPLASLGEFLPGLLLLGLASAGGRLTWTLSLAGYLVIVVLSGAVIEGAMNIIFATFDFWFEQTTLLWVPETLLSAPALYPTHIYGPVLTFTLTFLFPFAFIAYYPAHAFLGREVPVYGQVLVYMAPVVAVALMAIAVTFWSAGLRRYRSTGT